MTPNNPGRILALDLGARRIGLALSDELGVTAQGLPTLRRSTRQQDIDKLYSLAVQHKIKRVVVGHPVNMNGSKGPKAHQAAQFANTLRKHLRLPAVLWDERLTTRQAQRVLRESGVGITKRAKAIDRMAAVLILQSYLDFLEADQDVETDNSSSQNETPFKARAVSEPTLT
jgi:putative Holliday junction resolvase